ncbi:hypothetical protein FPCIR_5262 [Fusarium pseudocircinatum]|uniref:Uncharacterized protein n=1 Tax=Fusarium pseudocircinatum TaxID=56676 RepID=A0A8H5PBL1_9HYPO|nr:hypothetical protein FPCIR_5262 [Fusarium pseudocircinatum]
MSGDNNSTAFLDNSDLIGSGFQTMARVTAGAVVRGATATVTETATETSVPKQQVDYILDILFAVLTALAALVSIAIIFTVVRSFSKVKGCMPPPGDDNGHVLTHTVQSGLNMYGSYRKAQVHFIFIIMFMLGCLATFTLATAKLMLLDKIEGSADLLSIAFAVQALTLLATLLASRSLMENTLTIFMEKEADMEVNEWDPKL